MWPGGEIYVAEWCPLVTILVFSSSAHFSFSYLCNKKHVDGLPVQPTPCSSDPRDRLAPPWGAGRRRVSTVPNMHPRNTW